MYIVENVLTREEIALVGQVVARCGFVDGKVSANGAAANCKFA